MELPQNWQNFYQEQGQKSTSELLQNFYKNCPLDQKTIADTKFVALDFETTGLNSENDGIVSIGLIEFDHQKVYTNTAKYWVVKPRESLTRKSVTIHGITHSETSDAPDLIEILDKFLKAIENKIVVVHFRHIERNFLHSAIMERLNEEILFPVVDTMQLEMNYLKSSQGFFAKLFNKPTASVRLNDCRKRYHLPLYSAHNALTDALATAELLQAQIKYHFSSNDSIFDIIN